MGETGQVQVVHGVGQREPNPAAVSAVAWQPAGRELDLAEWVYQGKRLGSIGRGASWWIGDWVNYGNARFGEKYVRAAQATGYDVQTLMNMAYVASRFSVSRRRETLSWSHHAEVAGLPPEQREQWLEFAETGRMSVRGLREELRRLRAQTKQEPANNRDDNRVDNSVDNGVDNGVDNTERDTKRSDEAAVVVVSDDPSRCPRCGCVLHAASADMTRREESSTWATI